MDEILKEQGFQQSGTCIESSCFIEEGQLLGVKNLVTGSVGKVGRTYSITVNLISVRTGEIEKVVSHSYAGSIDNLLTREMEVVGQRLAGVKVNSVNKRKISARKAFPIAIGIAGLMTGTGAALSFLEKNHTEKDYHKADNQVDIDRLAKDINSARTRGIVFSSATALLIPTAVATYLLGNSNEENNENPRDNQRLEISLFPVFNEYASGFSLKIQF